MGPELLKLSRNQDWRPPLAVLDAVRVVDRIGSGPCLDVSLEYQFISSVFCELEVGWRSTIHRLEGGPQLENNSVCVRCLSLGGQAPRLKLVEILGAGDPMYVCADCLERMSEAQWEKHNCLNRTVEQLRMDTVMNWLREFDECTRIDDIPLSRIRDLAHVLGGVPHG